MEMTQKISAKWQEDLKSFDSAKWLRWGIGTFAFAVTIGSLYGWLSVVLA